MNERVVFKVELYKQALKFAYETAGVDTENGTILASLTAGRFAELIVKECSNFLKDTLDDHFAAEQLEEHFGVEE